MDPFPSGIFQPIEESIKQSHLDSTVAEFENLKQIYGKDTLSTIKWDIPVLLVKKFLFRMSQIDLTYPYKPNLTCREKVCLSLFINTVIHGQERTSDQYFKKTAFPSLPLKFSLQYSALEKSTYIVQKFKYNEYFDSIHGRKRLIQIPDDTSLPPKQLETAYKLVLTLKFPEKFPNSTYLPQRLSQLDCRVTNMINYTDRVRLALFIETVILGVERTANDYFKKDRSSHSSSPLSVQYLSERQATYVQLKQLGASILHELCGDKKVTLAIEIPNNRDCSPTFVAQSVNNEPDCFKDVSKEAEILKQFSGHKGIWPLLGYATHQKEDQTPTISIFTPLGIPTDRILRNNKNLPIFQHIELADQITCGVYTLHKENRIHGDLKPDNVLFSTISGSKIVAGLIDLGSSLLTSEGPGDPSYDRCYLSDGYYTSVVFTPPELFGNENFKGSLEKVEIFALGCLLYSLFLQKLPPWVNFLDEYWTYFRKKVMTSKTVFERTNKSFSKYVENYIEISRDTLLKKENLSIEKEYLLFIYNMMRLNPEDRLDSLSATKEIALLQEKALALQLKNTLKL